jgi:DNA polymerase-3 subunit epsilon
LRGTLWRVIRPSTESRFLGHSRSTTCRRSIAGGLTRLGLFGGCGRSFRGVAPGSPTVAEFLGLAFQHHVAEEDARVAGEIFLRAVGESCVGIDTWLHQSMEPVGGSIAREGAADGALYGETIVFTGALSVPRREAAVMAAAIGCAVTAGVTGDTTILVVGDQDIRKLAGHAKSSKHRKAEERIEQGQGIRILVESDFRRLVQLEGIS